MVFSRSSGWLGCLFPLISSFLVWNNWKNTFSAVVLCYVVCGKWVDIMTSEPQDGKKCVHLHATVLWCTLCKWPTCPATLCSALPIDILGLCWQGTIDRGLSARQFAIFSPPSHSSVPGLFCRLLGCTELPLAFSFECLQQVRLQCFSACTAPAVNAGHKVTDIL